MKSDGVNDIPTGDTLLYKALFIIPVLAFFVLVLLFFYISIELDIWDIWGQSGNSSGL